MPAVTFTVEALSNAAEGGGAGQFRVTANGDAADFTSPVYAIVMGLGGTATNGTDYTPSQAVYSYMTFNTPGSTATLSITAVDDSNYEGDETVTLTVQRYQMYPMGPTASDTLTLVDDDPAPTVAVGAAWDAVEGGAWGIFRFTRDGDTTDSLTFSYTVLTGGSGVATAGTDYTALSGTATFPAGESVLDVEVEAALDSTTESPETVTVTVDDGANYDPAEDLDEATVTISDPDPTVVSVYRLYDAAEGETGAFLFSRTGDTSTTLTVTYTIATSGSGLATSDTDYTALSGSVTIAAGSSYAVVDVEALTDNAVEGAEAVVVSVSTATSYDIDVGSATVYVTDDAPTVWIYSSPSSVDEGASGTIVLKRSGGNLDEELVVPVNISVGEDEDLVWVRDFSVSGTDGDWSEWNTVTFPAGEDTVVLTLEAVLDEDSEDTEDVQIEIDTGSSAYTAGLVSSVVVHLADIVPNITVPIQAGEPLSGPQANLLAAHLARYGRYGREGVAPAPAPGRPDERLTTAQYNEMVALLDRFRQFGLASTGPNRLAEFQSILDGLSGVPTPVGPALALYAQATDRIVAMVNRFEEAEYRRFKEQMAGATGAQAATKFAEIQGGFRPAWVGTFWIRYQAEQLQRRYNR